MIKIENPAAFSFFLDDDLYLLDKDKKPAVAPTVLAPPMEGILETPVVEFNFLGGNKKNFLIVVHYPSHRFMDDSHFAALESILKRRELNLDDVAIFNRFNFESATIAELTNYFKPAKLLLMGDQALPRNMAPLALNKPLQLNGAPTLYSFSFEEMMGSNDKKRTFWELMKTL